ncbi:hypothetical protein [Kiloniella litopenaei]|uniref:hypothetical protein n=1 Tax=Kiloniella litopenaei TaxID=1549748 RepID=UPI003BABB222
MISKQRLLDLFLLVLFPHLCLSVWISERVTPMTSMILTILYAGGICYFLFVDQPAIYYQLTQFWLLVTTVYVALPGLFFLARSFDKF